MRRYFCFILIYYCLACTKVIDYEIPREPDRISIDARIIEDESVNVICGTSSFKMDPGAPSTDSLYEVLLYENDVLIDKLQPEFSGHVSSEDFFQRGQEFYTYTSNFLPQSGNVYKVEVNRNGLPTASGKQYLPEGIGIENWNLDSVTDILNFSFPDPAGTEDFYSMRIVAVNPNGTLNIINISTSHAFIDFFYNHNDDPLGEDQNVKTGAIAYFSDEFFNGRNAQINVTLNQWEVFNRHEIYLELFRISEDLFLHERSKAGQLNTGGFFGESIQIYGNVENGLGIVGAMSPTRIRLN